MIRITTIFLCLLLAVAAAGRYRAEEEVRNTRSDIREIETDMVKERRAIQMLRAEVAYLENPERLAKIADAKTALRPTESRQIMTADEFVASFGDAPAVSAPTRRTPENSDVILHALAMAGPAALQ
ncbi:MAG: hypothetical protein AAGA09_06540 [Pseudomonadota bacterium]